MKVDFIIAGGQKCGTTALHYFLSKHPKILASNPKEIDFFNYDNNYNKGYNYYHSFFKKKPFLSNFRGYKFLEASPSYINGELFTDTLITAKRMLQYNPKLKVICLVRNPIDRAYSAWNMFRERKQTSKEDWWDLWFEEKTGNNPKAIKRIEKSFINFNFFVEEELNALLKKETIECPILENGKYYIYLEKFKSVLGKNLLIVQNEIFDCNTPNELHKICRFLNIEEIDWEFAKNKKVFSGNYLKSIDKSLVTELKSFYKEANLKLKDLTGINYL